MVNENSNSLFDLKTSIVICINFDFYNFYFKLIFYDFYFILIFFILALRKKTFMLLQKISNILKIITIEDFQMIYLKHNDDN